MNPDLFQLLILRELRLTKRPNVLNGRGKAAIKWPWEVIDLDGEIIGYGTTPEHACTNALERFQEMAAQLQPARELARSAREWDF